MTDATAPREPWDRRDWGVVAALAFVVTAVFADILFFGRNFYVRDVYAFYFPTKKLIHDLLLSGHIQWNPHYGAGQPMAANPEYEVFYPLQWLIFVGSYSLGFRLHIVAHVYLAAIGAYAFFRTLELRRATSAAGAVSFALGGFFLSQIGILPCLFAAAWLPLIALFSRRYLIFGRRRDLAGGSISLGLMLLIGEPTTILQTGLVLVIAAMFVGGSRIASLRRTAALVGGGIAVGLAQIVPMLDLIRDTARAKTFPFAVIASWSMPPFRLLELFHPTFFGRWLDSMQWWWGGSLYDAGTPFHWSIYCGVAVAVFAITGVICATRGRALFAALFGLSVILAMGMHTPLLEWLYASGIARNLRFPEKFILIGICAAIVFSFVTLDRMLRGDRAVLRTGIVIAVVLLALSIIAAVVFSSDTSGSLFRHLFNRREGPATDYQAALWTAEWWKQAGRLALLSGVLTLCRWRMRWAGTIALLIFITGDVLSVSREVSPSIDPSFYERPAIASNGAGTIRMFNEADWDFSLGRARPFPGNGTGFYWIVRNGLMRKAPVLWSIDPVLDVDYDLTNLQPTGRFTEYALAAKPSARNWPQPFATMADAKLHGVLVDSMSEMKRIRGDWPAIQPMAIDRVQTSGRYYFADAIATIHSDAEFASFATASGVPEKIAFIPDGAVASASPGLVKTVDESADRATVRVISKGQAFLVRSVTPHRYWRATIDGAPAQIVPTNVGFQGVPVPPGEHTIVFRYRNPLIVPSILLSIFALAVAIVFIARDRDRFEQETPS